MSQEIQNTTPRHVAIIMDGNGRWAKKRGLPRTLGHKAGTENVNQKQKGFLLWKKEKLFPYFVLSGKAE